MLNKINLVKKIILVLATLLSVYLYSLGSTRLLGQSSFWLLTLVIFIRPLAQLYPKLQILKLLLSARRQLGISTAIFVFAHVASQINPSFSLSELLGFALQSGPSQFLFWGVLGLFFIIPMFLTSNSYAVSILKKNWGLLHLLIHPLYISALIHRSLQGDSLKKTSSIILFLLLYATRLKARKRA
ncbi:ferric reductase-like transmembrane domain-containing protein [Candidatus Collierbacteria bacterium]|nr:ferric reductase-like transmembrane domain-containing protein [Candidatus Collierbacteria bacterium]